MANPLKPISAKQAIITISDISDVYWMSSKGGKVNREEIEYNDGKQGIIQTFVGFIKLENLVLMKSFDPAADKAVLTWIDNQIKTPTPFNVAIQPVKADLTGSPFEGSSQILYSNCQLGDYKLPEWDRNSTGLAMIEIKVIFNSLPTYQ
jgi:hypothetical protein